jgi:hypothetical protein
MDGYYELGVAWSFFAESMLSIGEDLVFVEMVHDVAVDYMLQYLTCDGGEGDRSIVGG